MKALFIIAIAIMAAVVLLCAVVRPRWWRVAWAIGASLSAGFAAPYLISVTPDGYRFIVYLILAAIAIAGVAPLAEKK